MFDELFTDIARGDFARARKREFFSKILNLFRPEKSELLSLEQIREILKPKKEVYGGMQTVRVSDIVGSEGRYKDFNREFLPKHNFMQRRWVNIDKAQLLDVILPPVKLYEIGGVFFVRDGNHRVSVAKIKGVAEIDAEVVSLSSDFPLAADFTVQELRERLIRHEQDLFYRAAGFEYLLDPDEIRFTSPGRYDALLAEIEHHRLRLEKKLKRPQTLKFAAREWYANVYLPAVDLILSENLLALFPKRTKGDMYVWILDHRNLLAKKFGTKVSMKDAVKDVIRMNKGGILRTIVSLIRGNMGKFR